MAKGNEILISAGYVGRRLEGIIAGTPKPGTCMALKNVALQSGRATWEPFGTTAASSNNGVAADGDQRLIAVLLPDELQGKAATVAYVTGSRCFLYCPLPGDELNMLFENQSGTGDDTDFVIGDLFMVDDGTGKLLVVDSDAQSEPFAAMETMSDVTADILVHTVFTGY